MKVWVIGAGYFGALSVPKLEAEIPGVVITLVDEDPAMLAPFEAKVETVAADGADFLAQRLTSGPKPDYVVAAVPVHLALLWVMKTAGPDVSLSPEAVPDPVFDMLPNPMRGEDGEVYVTHARHRCPDDCPEPDEVCRVTKLPRKPNMFDVLAALDAPGFRNVVLTSRQLAPGVGGYAPDALLEASRAVALREGRVLFSTACRCHGVMNAIDVKTG